MESTSLNGKLNIAFESGQLTYSNNPVDLYNSGVNQLLSLSAIRGHNLFHFSMNDLKERGGEGYARMSELELPSDYKGDPLTAYQSLRKTREKDVPLSVMDMFMLRADDVKKYTPNLGLLQRLEDDSIFLETIQDTLDTTDKYELVRRCPQIPSPVTYKADTLDEAKKGLDRLPDNEGYFVLKDRFGYGCGAQVHRLRFDDPDLKRKVGRHLSDYQNIILQEYSPEVRNGDLVATFFDGQHIATMKRLPIEGEWKTNASLGSEEVAYELSPENERIAKQVIDAFPGCRFASVDLLESGKVLEINAFPGANGLYNSYGIVIAEQILDKLEPEARNGKSKAKQKAA